jgi:putative nucleotidyltransferase with HDIG domain
LRESTAQKSKSNREYTQLLERLNDIPTLPIVAIRVNELINDPMSSGKQIAEVLKKDQVLTAKILKLANSSYYAIPGGVRDVQRALAFLGFNTIAQLILGLSIFSIFSKISEDDFSMQSFWKHALATAICSEAIAKKLELSKPEEAFTCGLLHDIGKLVMHEIDPERFSAIVAESKKQKSGFIDVEREWDLPGHTYLGEIVATKWGLPQTIQSVIRYHHQDVSEMDTLLPSVKPMIHVVRLANSICVKNEIGKSGDCSKDFDLTALLKPLKTQNWSLKEIEYRLMKDMERAGAFLSVHS